MYLRNQFQSLIALVTVDEVRDALFAIDNDKAPGPDGYGSFFFKATWDTTGFDLFRAVDGFFCNG